MPKRTFKPNKKKLLRKIGFRKKMQSRSGKNVLKSRRFKKRKVL